MKQPDDKDLGTRIDVAAQQIQTAEQMVKLVEKYLEKD